MRSKILKAAIRLFAERGYHRTTTEDVARAAKCGESVLAHHYHTKTDLFVASLYAADMQRSASIRCLREDPNLESAVERIMAECYKGFDKTYFRLRMFAQLERPDIMREFFEQVSLPFFKALRDRLRRERVAGNVRDDIDLDAATVAFIAMCGYWRMFDHAGHSFDDFTLKRKGHMHLAGIWLRGIKAR